MNSELATVDLHTGLSESDVSASRDWNESAVTPRDETRWVMSNSVFLAGMMLAIAAPTATAVPDYWFFETWGRNASTVAWTIEPAIGQRITRAEALRITAQILEQAERERSEFAAREGMLGIQWEASE